MHSARHVLSRADQSIIDNLLQIGNNRRRGEDQFFELYSYFIREGMIKYSLSEDEAFDAYSDTLLAAIDRISKGLFEGRSSLKTWLFQIFQNKCVDLLRKKTTNKNSINKTSAISDMLFQLSDSSRSIIQKLVDKSESDLLKQRLDEIGTKCRELLMLSADGYSDKQITSVLEYKTADVVKTSRLRCLEKLRQIYKRT